MYRIEVDWDWEEIVRSNKKGVFLYFQKNLLMGKGVFATRKSESRCAVSNFFLQMG
jgi:hypothetical protein